MPTLTPRVLLLAAAAAVLATQYDLDKITAGLGTTFELRDDTFRCTIRLPLDSDAGGVAG